MGFKFYMPWDDVPEEKQAEIAAARSQGPLGFDITGPQSVFNDAFDPTTQTTSSDPWGPQQPYLQNLFSQANNLYNQGFQTPDLSSQTQNALNTQYNLGANNPYVDTMNVGVNQLSNYQNPYAGNFSNYQGLSGANTQNYQNMISKTNPYTSQYQGMKTQGTAGAGLPGMIAGAGQNPYSGQMQGAISRAGGSPYAGQIGSAVSRAGQTPYESQFGGVLNQLGGVTGRAGVNPYAQRTESALNLALNNPALAGLAQGTGQDLTRQTAEGEFLGKNPYLDEMYGRASGKVADTFKNTVMPGIGTQFSSAGRYGSDAQKEALGEASKALAGELGGLATDIYGQDYGRERGFQEAARGQLGSQDLQRLGTMGGLYSSGVGQALGGLSDLTGSYQTGTGQQMQGIGQAGGLLGTMGGLRQAGTGQQLQGLGQLSDIYQTGTGQQMQGLGQLSSDYRTGLGQQLQGTGMMSDIEQQNIQNQMNQLGAMSNIYNTDFSNTMQGLGALDQNQQFFNSLGLNALGQQSSTADTGANIRMNALGMIPDIRNMQYQDAGAMLGAGQDWDTFNQQRNMDPYNALNMFGQSIMGNYGGTQTGPGPSQFDTWLNRASQGANVAAPFVLGGNQQQVYGDAYLPGNPYA